LYLHEAPLGHLGDPVFVIIRVESEA